MFSEKNRYCFRHRELQKRQKKYKHLLSFSVMFFNLLKEKVILNFFKIRKELYKKVKSLLLWKPKNERVNFDNYLKLQQRITMYFYFQ